MNDKRPEGFRISKCNNKTIATCEKCGANLTNIAYKRLEGHK